MPQGTWIKVSGTWRQVTNIWKKVAGVWTQGVISYIKVAGIWKQCIVYPVITTTSRATNAFDVEGVPILGGSFNVTSNVSWTVTYSQSWGYYLAPASGGAGTVGVTIVCPINYGAARSGYIYFRYNGITYATVYLEQAGI